MTGEAYRTTHAGELTPDDAGSAAKLAGWVARRRDHGGVIFVDLRDASGIVQVVLNPAETETPEDTLHGLRTEYCIAVSGTVR
ncbi:MAG: OB-fold nucleic acid binding domain-containing protein, partial [Acidimicrobiia bacterium]